MVIAIFDYGAGNIFSIKVALERLGAQVSVIRGMDDLAYDALVLPGVGNFDPAMRSISQYRDRLRDAIASGMPMLGICLGMEMLFERSEEGTLQGLSILAGDVVMLPKSVKVPHMGWNRLRMSDDSDSILLNGVEDGAWVYFVHSYHARPRDAGIVKASCRYGVEFPAVIEHGSLFGTQFHPEKSGAKGMSMLSNFLAYVKR
ncbi:MAG: imidazole glycerol phosphate synthase subunit HisH [Candidatus Nitrosocaldus sp.]|nr:imidazole glycerol phosphate synthase subunit HisH [Candidatus Nitrosocaldus sp.]MCS7141323.1 imidazole glycerol phosphate synthase subunit HisH [Candidatus Nitrosocaldus sp.]MDW8000288.1 imidazole glycerol phosphate synthase subunit HisH [Candidatus Nitrosocaldus sp.]MDW8274945.1 imidazole glycerol phosphate synthase subunit HisH [Candidatus Nitrosocaldus sp.]